MTNKKSIANFIRKRNSVLEHIKIKRAPIILSFLDLDYLI